MKKKLIIISSVTICFLLVLSTAIYAWYKTTIDKGLGLNNPNYDPVVFEVSPTGTSEFNLLEDLIGNQKIGDTEGAYIEDLAVTVKFTPVVASYIRIRINDSWLRIRTYTSGTQKEEYVYINSSERFTPIKNGDEVVGMKYNNYTFGNDWYYDHETGYVYYRQLLFKGTEIKLDFIQNNTQNAIENLTSVRFSDVYKVSIDFVAEVVQANRFEEIWGINKIPGGGN